MTEKTIEQYLVKRVKELGGKAYKFVSPGNAGVPDRLTVLPGARVAFAELKAPGRKPTPLQIKSLDYLAGLGFSVWVIDSKEDVDTYIAFELKRGGDANEGYSQM